MISLLKLGSIHNMNMKEYYITSVEELDRLPLNDPPMSAAYLLTPEDGLRVWMLSKPDGESPVWVEV